MKDMSFLVYFLLLHLCVSMHPCNSRHLGVFDKEPGGRIHLTGKTPETKMAEFEGRKSDADNMIQKGSNVHSDEGNMHKGIDIKVHISDKETKTEGWRTHARLAMESKHQDSKEAVNTKDNSITEDVVVMDYEQPHRKPPIHNMEP